MMKLILHFIIACMATFVVASVSHSQFVLAALSEVGVIITLQDRLAMTFSDLVGLLPGYGVIILIAFLLGFSLMEGFSRKVFHLSDYRFVIAGFLAIAVALLAMHPIFNVSLIAGARSPAGFIAQSLSGAIGGYVFMTLRHKSKDTKKAP